MTVAPSLGFKPLAGIASYQEAMKIGYSVEESVELLHRYLYLESQANRVMVAHLTGVPEWELKQAFSLHQWQDAEHSLWLHERARNMRYPTPQVDKVPDVKLQVFIEELLRSADSLELVVGLYQVLKPSLVAAYERHLEETNPVADYPTVRWLRFIVQEESEQIEWGQVALDALIKSDRDRQRAEAWADHLEVYLAAAGGIRGDDNLPGSTLPEPRAGQPFEFNRRPARDERFTRVMHFRGYGPGENAEAHEMNAWTVYKLLTEMHAPELLATYSYEVQGKPWEFYRDVGRHLFDECRHAMMGEVAFERLGLDWTKVPHDIGWALFSATELDPTERYNLLVSTEQRLMAPQGKASQYQYAVDTKDVFSRQCNDYDWADEVLHVQIGKKWLRDEFESVKVMVEQGAVTREKLLNWIEENMQLAVDPNWWDRWYAELCKRQGVPPKKSRAKKDDRTLDVSKISGG